MQASRNTMMLMFSLLAMLSGTAALAEPAAGTTLAAPKVPTADEALAAWTAFRADRVPALPHTAASISLLERASSLRTEDPEV